ncbi:tyrosine-type recombinase/integrase [Deinococcus knuensis]|uniref:Tyr recombinase domain-containing protein n=1 Tax=Deinococcus knuensis TaxID=1837380 RepID=A0ABQ2SHF5_9DEIO|nr:hypothetical protein GCM10008961_21580 [Deinococcus knuensis]
MRGPAFLVWRCVVHSTGFEPVACHHKVQCWHIPETLNTQLHSSSSLARRGYRHTHASLMLRRGVPLEVVSEKLGHSRPSLTADVYRTVYQSEHEEWAVNLSDLTSPKIRHIN